MLTRAPHACVESYDIEGLNMLARKRQDENIEHLLLINDTEILFSHLR